MQQQEKEYNRATYGGKPNPNWIPPTPASDGNYVSGAVDEARSDFAEEVKTIEQPQTIEDQRTVDLTSDFREYLIMQEGVLPDGFIDILNEREGIEADIFDRYFSSVGYGRKVLSRLENKEFIAEKIIQEVADGSREAMTREEFIQMTSGDSSSFDGYDAIVEKYGDEYEREKKLSFKHFSDDDAYDMIMSEIENNGFDRCVFSRGKTIEDFTNSLESRKDHNVDYGVNTPVVSFDPARGEDKEIDEMYIERLKDGEDIPGFDHYAESEDFRWLEDVDKLNARDWNKVRDLTKEWFDRNQSDDSSGYVIAKPVTLSWKSKPGNRVIPIEDLVEDPRRALKLLHKDSVQEWKQYKDGTLKVENKDYHEGEWEEFSISIISKDDFDSKYRDYVDL